MFQAYKRPLLAFQLCSGFRQESPGLQRLAEEAISICDPVIDRDLCRGNYMYKAFFFARGGCAVSLAVWAGSTRGLTL